MAIPAMPKHARGEQAELSPAWSAHQVSKLNGHYNKPEETEQNGGKWVQVGPSRRGGRWNRASSDSLVPSRYVAKTVENGHSLCTRPSATPQTSKCSCPERCKDYFCKSSRCRNDQLRDRPTGSVTTGRVGTDEGSPKSTITPRRNEARLQPKPSSHEGSPLIGQLERLQKALAPSAQSTPRSRCEATAPGAELGIPWLIAHNEQRAPDHTTPSRTWHSNHS